PGNKTANFGCVLTSLLQLSEDPQVAGLLVSFGQIAPTTSNLVSVIRRQDSIHNYFHGAVPFPAPQPSLVTAVLTNAVLPELESAVAKLRNIEGTGFTFEITPAMLQSTNT